MPISRTLPYSSEALAAFIANYHEAIWPLQIPVILLLLVTLAGFFGAVSVPSRIIAIIVSLFWIWVGAVFYLHEFSRLSFLAPVYGWCFLAQAGLLLWFLALRNRHALRFTHSGAGWASIVLIIMALIVYPGAAAFFEGQWQSYRLAGVTPLATSLYTLSLIVSANAGWPTKAVLSIIPLSHIAATGITAWLLL